MCKAVLSLPSEIVMWAGGSQVSPRLLLKIFPGVNEPQQIIRPQMIGLIGK